MNQLENRFDVIWNLWDNHIRHKHTLNYLYDISSPRECKKIILMALANIKDFDITKDEFIEAFGSNTEQNYYWSSYYIPVLTEILKLCKSSYELSYDEFVDKVMIWRLSLV